MKQGWALGNEAVRRLTQIALSYKDNRINNYLKQYPSPLSVRYHPVMSLIDFAPSFDLAQVVDSSREGEKLDFEINYLSRFNEVIASQGHLGSITHSNGGIVLKNKIESDFQSMLRDEVGQCLTLMKEGITWMYDMYQALIVKVHPVFHYREEFTEWSASDYYLNGLIFGSCKGGENARIRQGITISHELSHNVVYTLQTGMDTLKEGAHLIPTYSCIRKTNRPLRGAFHAAIALTYMSLFLASIENSKSLEDGERAFVKSTLSQYRSQLKKGLNKIQRENLTELGNLLMDEMLGAEAILSG